MEVIQILTGGRTYRRMRASYEKSVKEVSKLERMYTATSWQVSHLRLATVMSAATYRNRMEYSRACKQTLLLLRVVETVALHVTREMIKQQIGKIVLRHDEIHKLVWKNIAFEGHGVVWEANRVMLKQALG